MSEKDKHNDFEALCAGYVLDSLSTEDKLLFESMLDGATPEQRELYRDLSEIKDQFALTSAPASPPDSLEEKIFQSISDTPASGRPSNEDSSLIPGWAYKLAAAVLMAATLSLIYFTIDLTGTIEQKDAIITELQSEIDKQDQLLDVLAAREVKLVLMGGLEPSPDGYGKILWDTDNRRAVLQLANLPTPPEDKDYQLWLIKDDQAPISAGVFNFEHPSADLFFKVEHIQEEPSPLSNAFAVTLEPKGGMPQPTGDMFLIGQ